MTETFRQIPGFPAYAISPTGRILSYYTGKIRKSYKNKPAGYWRITLYQDGKCHTVEIHKLVAITWLEKPEGNVEVSHKDNNKDNNCVDNLEWVSHAENVQ